MGIIFTGIFVHIAKHGHNDIHYLDVRVKNKLRIKFFISDFSMPQFKSPFIGQPICNPPHIKQIGAISAGNLRKLCSKLERILGQIATAGCRSTAKVDRSVIS